MFNNEDRITMRINNIKKVQLIFHCGAKVKMQPKDKLISDDFGLLDWKENNRAVATFDDIKGIYNNKKELEKIIENWLKNAV